MSKEIEKIYKKQWLDFRIKKTILVGFLAALIINLLVFLVIGGNINEYYNNSIENNTEIKYIIPSPSQSQVDELKNKTYVNEIVSSSFLKFDIVINNKSIETPIVVIDEKTNLKSTPFSPKRKIKGEISLDEDTIFVDYLFSKSNKIKINDYIKLSIGNNELTYKVTGIYETNTLINSDIGSVLIYKSNRLNTFLTDNNYELKITNAYINASKEIESDYFNDYKAYGRLKNRSEFPDDDSYQIHYDNFIKTNFTNEIVYFKIQDVSSKTPVFILILNSIILLGFSLHNYIFLKSKREDSFRKKMISYGIVKTKEQKTEQEKKKEENRLRIISYYKKSFVIELIIISLFVIIPTIIYYFIVESSGIYILSLYKNIYFITIVVAIIFSIVVNYFIINKIDKQIKGL